jgi:predicted RNA binding protein YcfA (HicA-like mRNA interferase family)
LPNGFQIHTSNLTMCIDTYKVMQMKSADVIALLRKDGWFEVARKGSHIQFKHPTKVGRVTVPHPKRDIPIGTLRSIEKQAGLKLR